MKVLEAVAAAIAAEAHDRMFAVMGDANQDMIVGLSEKEWSQVLATPIMKRAPWP